MGCHFVLSISHSTQRSVQGVLRNRLGLYSFECSDDERARASIFAMSDEPYARYEVWRGMKKIAEGSRFICANGPLVPLSLVQRAAA
jgi:hypothetical protein